MLNVTKAYPKDVNLCKIFGLWCNPDAKLNSASLYLPMIFQQPKSEQGGGGQQFKRVDLVVQIFFP